MEFGYTEEQERFRKEVNDWLDANLPPDEELPADIYDLDDKTYALAKELRFKLVEKGWLHPAYPKKYGGGELSNEELEVLTDVFGRRRIPMLCDNCWLVGTALMALGTEEQKERWLPLIAQGKITSWQCFSEPEAGTDMANIKSTAIHQDDGSFLLNGQKEYCGDKRPADYHIVLAVTDPEAPRHRNLSMFMVKADSPGISTEPIDTIGLFRHKVIHYDDVRVPAENLIGELNQGWAAAQVSLAGERGGVYSLLPYQLFDDLIEYCKNTYRGGKRLADEPYVREILTDVLMEAKIGRLLFWRTFWRGGQGIPIAYEGLQNNLIYKEFLPEAAKAALEILGPSALVTSPKWCVLGGKMEFLQRYGLQTHGGGTPEALKIGIARAVGLPGRRRVK